MRINVGDPTGEAANLTDDELDALLAGVDTSGLDAQTEKSYGEYLDRWESSILGARDDEESADAKPFRGFSEQWSRYLDG